MKRQMVEWRGMGWGLRRDGCSFTRQPESCVCRRRWQPQAELPEAQRQARHAWLVLLWLLQGLEWLMAPTPTIRLQSVHKLREHGACSALSVFANPKFLAPGIAAGLCWFSDVRGSTSFFSLFETESTRSCSEVQTYGGRRAPVVSPTHWIRHVGRLEACFNTPLHLENPQKMDWVLAWKTSFTWHSDLRPHKVKFT